MSLENTFECTMDGMQLNCEAALDMDFETYDDAAGNPVVDSDGNPVDPDAIEDGECPWSMPLGG